MPALIIESVFLKVECFIGGTMFKFVLGLLLNGELEGVLSDL
jgi:hypothetical protein